MFIQAPTTTMIANARPSHAQKVRPTRSPPGLSIQRMNVKINISTARAAVIMAGVTPISNSRLARRSACHTMSAIASRPAIQPIPFHMLTPRSAPTASASSAPGPSYSNQLKNETIRNSTVAPNTSLAPVVRSLNLSIFRRFLSVG